MDLVFVINLLFTIILLSIPFWPKKYLFWGMIIVMLLGISWILFNGCPLVKFQTKKTTPSKELIMMLFPKSTAIDIVRYNYVFLMFIMFILFWRISKSEN